MIHMCTANVKSNIQTFRQPFGHMLSSIRCFAFKLECNLVQVFPGSTGVFCYILEVIAMLVFNGDKLLSCCVDAIKRRTEVTSRSIR
jgi:hypothetical protein